MAYFCFYDFLIVNNFRIFRIIYRTKKWEIQN